jgi:GGDEF domain-containing protein
LAVLTLYGEENSSFSKADQNLLLALAPKLGASIGNAYRFERAESACRRAFFERLDAELARTRRGGGSLAVIECSVKNPDWAACGMDWIEAGLRSLCREYDFISRREQGFVIVLADFARAHLQEKQARIESVFRNAGLSVSIGVAFFPEDGADAEDLLARVHGAVHA